MKTPTLGKQPSATDQTDAIHFAIAPVIANEDLQPGDHVGLIDAERMIVGKTDNPIGIVDPFLSHNVENGDRVWLMLYPNTITSLRHEWTHPAFGATPEKSQNNDESIAFIQDIANQCDVTVHRLLQVAEDYVLYDDCEIDNSEHYKDVNEEDWALFWHHFEIVTGISIKEAHPSDKFYPDAPFTCAC